MKQLRGAIESGYKTVGVVTPFTAQARLIDQIAKTQFGQDFLDDIDFVSGTAHRLQGDERDAVILSSVLSPGMSKSGARWIEKERNLLNVAVSRARRALIVLGHPLMGDLGSPTLASLRVYLRDEVARNEGTGSLSAEFRTDSTSENILPDAMQLQAKPTRPTSPASPSSAMTSKALKCSTPSNPPSAAQTASSACASAATRYWSTTSFKPPIAPIPPCPSAWPATSAA